MINIPGIKEAKGGSVIILSDSLKPSAPVMEISEPVLQQCSGAAAVIQEHSATPQAVHSSVSLPQAVGEALSDGVLKEDVMDISRSDVDEGEITQSNSDSVAEAHGDSGMIDDEESYKPPSDIGARQRLLNEVQSDDEPEKADINMQDNTPTGDANAGNISDVPHSIEEISNNASMQHEEHSAHRSPFLADYSDPEDYEPPEPSRSAEDTALPLPISAHDSEASFSPLEADANDVDAPTQSVSQPGVHSGPKDENVGANPLEV